MNSFKQLKEWYAQTKPIVSKCHTAEDDVRPVSDRKRKWERMIKVHDNKYAISDGEAFWYVTNPDHNVYEGAVPMRDVAVHYSPITWYMHKGVEYLRVRNTYHSTMGPSFQNFMRCNLPRGMSLHTDNILRVDGAKYYLPRPEYGPWGYIKTYNPAIPLRTKLDKDYLVFKVTRENPDAPYYAQKINYELVTKKFKKPVKRVRVDKKAKAAVRPDLFRMREYIENMSMLFPKPAEREPYSSGYKDWQAIHREWEAANAPFIDMLDESNKRILEALDVPRTWRNVMDLLRDNPQLMHDVLSDDEHDLYYMIAFRLWYATDGHHVTDNESLKLWRNRFNQRLNRMLVLTTTHIEKVDI